MAFLKSEGTVPESREVFMILTKVGNKGSFTILVEMGSRWHYANVWHTYDYILSKIYKAEYIEYN